MSGGIFGTLSELGLGKSARAEPPDGRRDQSKTDQNARGNGPLITKVATSAGFQPPAKSAVQGSSSRPGFLASTSAAPARGQSLLSPSQSGSLIGLGVRSRNAPVVKQWCKEIKVGTWQSGEATVTFEEEVFSWITKREVPDCGFITLKIRTSSIHEAVFDKRSNVLKIRGIVEVPMDKLDRYYDFLSNPGSPKGYLCLTFNNMNNLIEVLKAVPRLKARTTFQNGKLPGWSDTAGAGGSSAPGAAAAARASAAARHDERVAATSRGAAASCGGGSSAGSRQLAAASSGKQPAARPKQRLPPPSTSGGFQTTLEYGRGHSSGGRSARQRQPAPQPPEEDDEVQITAETGPGGGVRSGRRRRRHSDAGIADFGIRLKGDKAARIAVYPEKDAKDAIVLTEDELARLEEGEFLNDSLVDYRLRFFQEELKSVEPEMFERCHFFNSFFYKRLLQTMQGESSSKQPEHAYQHVRRWTKHVDLFTKDYIFVPINESLHWSLAVVCRPGLWAKQQHAALPSQQPAAAEEDDSETEEDAESDGDESCDPEYPEVEAEGEAEGEAGEAGEAGEWARHKEECLESSAEVEADGLGTSILGQKLLNKEGRGRRRAESGPPGRRDADDRTDVSGESEDSECEDEAAPSAPPHAHEDSPTDGSLRSVDRFEGGGPPPGRTTSQLFDEAKDGGDGDDFESDRRPRGRREGPAGDGWSYPREEPAVRAPPAQRRRLNKTAELAGGSHATAHDLDEDDSQQTEADDSQRRAWTDSDLESAAAQQQRRGKRRAAAALPTAATLDLTTDGGDEQPGPKRRATRGSSGGAGSGGGSTGGSIVLEGSEGEGEAKPKKGSIREERRKKRAREEEEKALAGAEEGEQTCILYLDSLGGHRERGIMCLKWYLEEEYKNKMTRRAAASSSSAEAPPPVDDPKFRLMETKEVKAPRQHNHSDCGLYMLQFIEKLATHASALKPPLENTPHPSWSAYEALNFVKEDVRQMRRDMKRDIELLGEQQADGA